MSILVFIFMMAKAGFIASILDRLKEIPEVKEAYAVTGGIDIIIKAEVDDYTQIAKIVLAKIHKLDGVERTSTHIVANL